MIKIENVDVYGWEAAIRGMRNPMNSWEKSDTVMELVLRKGHEHGHIDPNIGPADLKLMHNLYVAGTEHRKYLRQIHVSMDIVSNHIFWAEFDTYKVGVTRNSCSKMHRIHVKGFSADDFSHEGIDEVGGAIRRLFNETLNALESLRLKFNETQEKKYWRAMLEFLPMGYNLRATVTMNYENVVTIIRQRTGHKLDEWNTFVSVLRSLPYVKEIIGG